MRSSAFGLGEKKAVTARPTPPSNQVSSERERTTPFLNPFISLVSIAECFLISFALKTNHEHPHTHEERFKWQTNVFLNIMIVYFALETASPCLHHVIHATRSRIFIVGLHCDYIVLWTSAFTCVLPIEFYLAAGDVTLSRVPLVFLYLGFASILFVRVVAFIHAVRFS